MKLNRTFDIEVRFSHKKSQFKNELAFVERKTGFEPATFSLEGCFSKNDIQVR